MLSNHLSLYLVSPFILSFAHDIMQVREASQQIVAVLIVVGIVREIKRLSTIGKYTRRFVSNSVGTLPVITSYSQIYY